MRAFYEYAYHLIRANRAGYVDDDFLITNFQHYYVRGLEDTWYLARRSYDAMHETSPAENRLGTLQAHSANPDYSGLYHYPYVINWRTGNRLIDFADFLESPE